jgi:hypothetical protein
MTCTILPAAIDPPVVAQRDIDLALEGRLFRIRITNPYR